MWTKAEVEEQAIKRREMCDQVKSIIVERLGLEMEPDLITDDQPLFGRGLELDSIDALELAVGVEDQFEVSITDDNMAVFGSVNTMVDYIVEKQGEWE
jgi:acyl carrier protein